MAGPASESPREGPFRGDSGRRRAVPGRAVDAGFDVVAVLTRPDAPLGRKRVLTPSPVAARAAELGIEIIHAAKVDAGVTARIAAAAPDVAAIVAYGGLIPRAALAVPRHGWVNLHFSLLPAWRGAAPVQRAVIAGDDVTGAVTFRLEEGLDTGPVFGTLTETVHARRHRRGLARTALPQRCGPAGPDPVRHRRRQGRRAAATGRCQPGTQTQPRGRPARLAAARTGDRPPGPRSHARSPAPGPCWTASGSSWSRCCRPPESAALRPGQLAMDGKRVLVGTGSHPVELTRVQPAGKKMMAAADWARGQATLESVVFE